MNDADSGVAGIPAVVDVASRERDASGAYRGRLFRRYLLLILTLVTIALLASGAISVYFTYQETKSSLADLQHEKAVAAVAKSSWPRRVTLRVARQERKAPAACW